MKTEQKKLTLAIRPYASNNYHGHYRHCEIRFVIDEADGAEPFTSYAYSCASSPARHAIKLAISAQCHFDNEKGLSDWYGYAIKAKSDIDGYDLEDTAKAYKKIYSKLAKLADLEGIPRTLGGYLNQLCRAIGTDRVFFYNDNQQKHQSHPIRYLEGMLENDRLQWGKQFLPKPETLQLVEVNS